LRSQRPPAAALLLATAGSPHAVKEGGTFRIAQSAGSFVTIDPALVSSNADLHLTDAACGNLMAYPSKPLPEGGRLQPELAEADPVVSKDGRTYRSVRDARFSDGSRVTARGSCAPTGLRSCDEAPT
jgi:ABC-type transport system substrate-binding protein